ncbi:SacI homology domain-containing protein [Cladochytrium replicatum]|nr:SacI homology domain-containing protein [Cladochytrium replicatum]
MPYEQLNLHVSGSAVVVEPASSDSRRQREILVIDRDSGNVSLESPPKRDPLSGATQSIQCFGIVGFLSLRGGDHVILIKERTRIGQLYGHPVYKLKTHGVLPLRQTPATALTEEELQDDATSLSLLEQFFATCSFYFSTEFELTHTLQRRTQLPNDDRPMWKRADQRFFWNHFLVKRIIDATNRTKESDMGNFILPITCGFMEIHRTSINRKPFTFALLSRRSIFRAGTRYHVRGVDEEGNVANFVETEQLVVYGSGEQSTSFIQTRGSIPIYWKQIVNVKYVPQLLIEQRPDTLDSFKKHFEDQFQRYDRQIAVNLINQKGYEAPLGVAFKARSEEFGDPRLRYVGFDFHEHCRKMRWDKISLLIDEIRDDLEKQGYSATNEKGQLLKGQTSVVRTNCMDCLDRTNVVQSVLAKRSLEIQFHDMGILEPSQTISDLKDFESLFKNIWADNADEVSRQYSGTGALKTDFTRTGKRTKMGALQDGVNSVVRYIRNNFMDGNRQDAFDLMLGVYETIVGTSSPFRVSSTGSLQVTALSGSFFVSLIMVILTLFMRFESLWRRATFFLLWSAVLAATANLILRNGKDFVQRPRLRAAALAASLSVSGKVQDGVTFSNNASSTTVTAKRRSRAGREGYEMTSMNE